MLYMYDLVVPWPLETLSWQSLQRALHVLLLAALTDKCFQILLLTDLAIEVMDLESQKCAQLTCVKW